MIRKLVCALLICALFIPAAQASGRENRPSVKALTILGRNNNVSSMVLTHKLNFEGRAEWKSDGNKLRVRARMENLTSDMTVKAFELYMYAVDVWGDPIYGDTYYYATTKRTIKPGERAYSDYMTLPDRKKIDRVYIGIHRVAFTDGTTLTVDDPEYYNWTITYKK